MTQETYNKAIEIQGNIRTEESGLAPFESAIENCKIIFHDYPVSIEMDRRSSIDIYIRYTPQKVALVIPKEIIEMLLYSEINKRRAKIHHLKAQFSNLK